MNDAGKRITTIAAGMVAAWIVERAFAFACAEDPVTILESFGIT